MRRPFDGGGREGGGFCGCEAGGLWEAQGVEFAESAEGLFEVREGDGVADEREVEGSEVGAFG